MSLPDELELLVEPAPDGLRLRCPAVGLWTAAVPSGRVLTPGAPAGVLLVLGRAHPLRTPEGVVGVVRSAAPERVHQPVGYGEVLYELGALEGEAATRLVAPQEDALTATGLVLRSPQSGRFYHRPSPDAEPLVALGDELADGDPIGLIEVMKTFATVPYRARGGLPARARVLRLLAGDGSDVAEGQPLLVVEPL